MNRYSKPEDGRVLSEIKSIIKSRPSYGHKRVTAMLNRNRQYKGLPVYNRKRIYRIMDMNGLMLKKNKPQRDHHKTGKIITLHSNTRWCRMV